MSTQMHRIALVAAIALALSAPMAPRAIAAPTIDDAGAQAIVAGVHALLVEMFGAYAPAAGLLTATAKDDHYHIEIPITHAWKGGSIGGDSAGADLIPLGDGRWQIANGKIPGRVEIDDDHPGPGEFKTMVATVKDSALSGVIDTTLATESKLVSAIHGFTTQTTAADRKGEGTIASLSSTTTVSPAQDGRVTLLSTGSASDYALTSTSGTTTFDVTAQKLAGTTRVEGLSFSALRTALHTLSTMVTLAPPSPGKPTDPATSKALHAVIAALADSATAISFQGTEDGINFKGPDPVRGSVEHVGFDVEGGDKGGQTSLGLGFSMRGLALPGLPPGPATTFLPKRVLLHIAFSGLDSATLHKSLDEGVDDPSPDAAMGLIMAALAAHPATIAIDKLDIQTGPATITGQGTVTTNGPSHTVGEATIRATGFDAALKEISADPQSKDVMPALLMAKGLGKQDGDAMVWKISFDGQKLLVNGTEFGGPPKQ